MKFIYSSSVIFLLFIFYLQVSSCKQSSFLDKTSDQALALPRTLDDIEMLLRSRFYYHLVIPSLGEAASDDYYVTSFPTADNYRDRVNLYTWQKEIYSVGNQHLQWSQPYQVVFYANTALYELGKLEIEEEFQSRANELRAEALFHRAHIFFHLAQLFADPYNPSSAASKVGIPLRVTADVNEKISRALLQETYDRIVTDLLFAAQYLPTLRERWVPSVEAVHALLARVYLTMGDFKSAKRHADTTLILYDTLLDYKSINSDLTYPFSQFNPEVLFHSTFGSSVSTIFARSRNRVAPALLDLYQEGDIRKSLFFREEVDGFSYRGSYDGSAALFFGLAVDELLLIRAECLAREGEIEEALKDLNQLRKSRFKESYFEPFNILSKEELMDTILLERRRELPFRGLRWIDLRRLNEMGYGYSLSREYEGQTYTLAPGSDRWTFPIPPEVISFNPDMPQN